MRGNGFLFLLAYCLPDSMMAWQIDLIWSLLRICETNDNCSKTFDVQAQDKTQIGMCAVQKCTLRSVFSLLFPFTFKILDLVNQIFLLLPISLVSHISLNSIAIAIILKDRVCLRSPKEPYLQVKFQASWVCCHDSKEAHSIVLRFTQGEPEALWQ